MMAQKPDGDAQRMTGQPINSHKSAWLDHWKLLAVHEDRSMRAQLKVDSPLQAMFYPQDAVSSPEQLITSNKCPGKNILNLAVSTSFQSDNQLGSPILLHGSKKKWPSTQCFIHQEGGICQSGLVTTSKDYLGDVTFGNFSVHGKKTEGPSGVRKLESQSPDRNDDPLLLRKPSAHVNLLQNVVGEEVEKVNSHSNIRMLPTRGHHLGTMKPDEPYQQYFSLSKVPLSFHDVEATPLTLSPRMHQFFITRTSNPKLYKVGNVYRESTISAKFNGEMVTEVICLSPSFGFSDKQQAKLQAFGSSTDGEAAGNANRSLVLKNESSAETDTMEMDAFQKGHVSDVALGSPNQSNKKVQHSLSTQTASSSMEEILGEMKNTKLPDINVKSSASPAFASSITNREHSTSRTQSLDAEHVFLPAQRATTSKGAGVWNSSPGAGPSGRWIKRLKLDISDAPVHGSKSLEISEASAHEKISKMSSRVMKQMVASSEPMFCRIDDKTDSAPDQTTTLLKKVSTSSTGTGRKSGEITLSHFWIQRWCTNRLPSSKKDPKARVPCKRQSSKATVNEIENRLFPSIGAMALMGNTLARFHRCDIRRIGSTMVWNA